MFSPVPNSTAENNVIYIRRYQMLLIKDMHASVSVKAESRDS